MAKTELEESGGLENDYRALKKKQLDTEAELIAMKESNKRYSTTLSKMKKKYEGTDSLPIESDQAQIAKSSAAEHPHGSNEPPAEPLMPSEPPKGLPPAPGVLEKAKEETVHLVKSWSPRFCPDCGTKNPDFQDEVQCHNCKIGLGAKSKVQSGEFKVCPNCGLGKDNGGGWEFVPRAKIV
jgi:hypothetical protein